MVGDHAIDQNFRTTRDIDPFGQLVKIRVYGNLAEKEDKKEDVIVQRGVTDGGERVCRTHPSAAGMSAVEVLIKVVLKPVFV